MVAKKATTPTVNLSETKGLGTRNQTFSKTQMATTSHKQIDNKNSILMSKKRTGDDMDFYEDVDMLEFDDGSEVDTNLDYTTQY